MDEISARDQAQFRDPERRWLRHTFQEGPGFRFLATRGGRPPEHQRRRGQIAAVRARARAVRIAREDGLAVVLDSGTISRTTLWRWLCAYERAGLAALVPERRGPRNPALTHPAWLEQVVITVRLHTYWNAKRISAELRRREIADVGHRWISQLLDDLGAHRPSGPRERGPRYERSSFVIGLRIATDQQSGPILVWLRDCVELCGLPLDLMSDNGAPFVTWMPGVLTRFGKTLRELEVRHIRTQVDSPWTNGKIEAFWATLKNEVLDREVFRSLADAGAALERFARYYNYPRLHGEIGWLTPAERFDGTPFTDRGFDNIPALGHLVPWLEELRKAA